MWPFHCHTTQDKKTMPVNVLSLQEISVQIAVFSAQYNRKTNIYTTDVFILLVFFQRHTLIREMKIIALMMEAGIITETLINLY